MGNGDDKTKKENGVGFALKTWHQMVITASATLALLILILGLYVAPIKGDIERLQADVAKVVADFEKHEDDKDYHWNKQATELRLTNIENSLERIERAVGVRSSSP